jgi:hypothetical protein
MEEAKTQEQTEAVVPPAQAEVKTPDTALEERLKKLEEVTKEQKSYLTKLEQENATYRQIITDRGQQAPVRQEQPAPQVSGIDAKIAELERKLHNGEITAEQLAIENLRLVREAKEAGKQEAIKEVTGLYTREQQIQRSFNNIFEDADLKGMEKEFGDIAAGYLNAGVGYGYNLQQAEQYARDQVKAKIAALRSRFGSAAPTPPPVTPAPVQAPVAPMTSSGLKGEGEGVKQPEKQDKPVTAEESQKSFIDIRRERMMRQRGA